MVLNPAGKGSRSLFKSRKVDGEKIVIDDSSGLMWQQSGSIESLKWLEVEGWLKGLNERGYAGYSDWRLPTLEEAMSLLRPVFSIELLYVHPLFDQKQRSIWTSDRIKSETDENFGGWVIFFNIGVCNYYDNYNASYVRAMRLE